MKIQRKSKKLHISMQPSFYEIYDCMKCMIFNFSALNEHRFKHAFDCLSPLCFCGKDNENNKHFLLHCPLYDVLRRDLFDQLSDVPGLDIASISNMDDDTLCHRLLLGDPSLGTIENRIILEATISFIKSSGRFD